MEKTALQQLKEKLQTVVDDLKDAIPGTDQYGYRDAMRNVILDIDMQMIPAERDAIVEAHKAGDPFNLTPCIETGLWCGMTYRWMKTRPDHNIHDAEQYYETRYGK